MNRAAHTGHLVWVVALLACGLGLYQAVARMWVCDDAFISFRYAQNLLDGHGLVFNAEERVEGYTNFLWTILVAGAGALSWPLVEFAQWAGLALFGGTLALLLGRSRRSAAGIPLAAAGLALHRHVQEFSSCGLETALFTFLTTALVLRAASATRPRHWLLAGVLGCLLAMTRPDGALFCAVAGAAAIAAAVRDRRPALLSGYALPFLLVYLPYFVWKWSYYGYPLPNTFYAKSGADPYAGQGLYYVLLFFQTYWILLPALVLLPWLALRRGRSRLAVLAAASSAVYLAFVVWVGGDFMFARFLVPITPLLYLGLELGAERLPGPRSRAAALLAAVVGTLSAWQHPELQGSGPEFTLRGIGDERAQYPPERVAFLRGVGEAMGEVAGDARVVFFGTQAMLVYEAGFVYALEGTTGLTDEHLAHLPLDERGQVGHEKSIYRDPAYALQRRVHFLLERNAALVGGEPYREITFFGLPATIVRYDRALMRRLGRVEGIEFTDFEAYLDDYLQGLAGRDPARVRRDLAAFRAFYFLHNDDPQRLAALQRAAR